MWFFFDVRNVVHLWCCGVEMGLVCDVGMWLACDVGMWLVCDVGMWLVCRTNNLTTMKYDKQLQLFN